MADALAGRGAALLPVPAHDDRQTAVLTTALRAGEAIDDDVAVVMATSGTTGTPKGAMLTAAALVASAEATHGRLGGAGRWLLALPAYHVAGLQVLVRSIVAGADPVAVPADVDPADLPAAVRAMGSGRRYASVVAVQLDKALRSPAAAVALAELDGVLVGGGPMPAGLAERAAAAGISVVRTYGMSETAGGCVYDGLPLAGVGVRVAGDGVQLSGPVLALGYRLDPAGTAEAFADGWFRTRDAGSLAPDGALTVHGRLDDVVISGGVNVAPQAVEATLREHPAVVDAVVFGRPDDEWGTRVVAAVVPAPGAAPALPELRAWVAERMGAPAAPRELHLIDTVPTLHTGKPDRRAVAQAVRG